MPDWLNATSIQVMAAIATIITAPFVVLPFFFRERASPADPGAAPRQPNRILLWVARALPRLGALLARVALRAWHYLRTVAARAKYGALYYIPGIKYEMPALPNVPEEDVVELNDSNVFFSERFADAFPAINGMTAYTRAADIAHRLDILLRAPLCGWERGQPNGSVPIWWFRGMGNLHIYRWAHLKPKLSLMNNMELDIARIVAIPGVAYWQNFVYVECRALPQVGLYGWTAEDLERKARDGHGYEEYAVYGHRIFNRQQYDDAGYEVRGRVRHFRHRPQLRVRHITPFNFVIAPVMSPVNVVALDGELDRRLRLCRENPAAVDQLAEWLLSLPKRAARH